MLTLITIQKLLEEERFDCQIVEIEGKRQLSVYMGEDHRQRGYWAMIRMIPEPSGEERREAEEEGKFLNFISSVYTLEFPFTAKSYAVADAARFVAFLNNSIELPGFQLDEVTGMVSYRYVSMVSIEGFQKQSVLAILGMLFMLKELYTETLEKVCSGSVTMNEVFEEIVEILQKGSTK